MKKLKPYIILHIILLIYSMGGIFSKTAASKEFLSLGFCFNYGMVILILGIYALLWQQVIKMLPLNVAYSNKAVTIVWGMLWGTVFFNEQITLCNIIGSLLVIAGVVIMVWDDGKKHE